ncbi:cell division protein DIVIC [Bacillus pseudomycoides]|uniref:Cell division protein DIVIC n=1 Tax=Bacillus pseudomycoides TaxID=64104 RepID=A0A2A8BBJ0_9BACI|nr:MULTISPECIES: septum formation initiator family protein [Bacillus]AIK39750.1 septum formation initiator family protein [Bacillus pseudomycoides]AJI18058.1 septum formation initiator family protein [Bacillus pseudomycoides]KFN14110.1 septum formation initiator family protein [Bacillus pseudomycoides]MBD5797812.1 cell division protein DIVIC [Bacillus pseudomycoides]MCR8860723.1 septum formation initiator family protein [Bacillus pseudomycoides]
MRELRQRLIEEQNPNSVREHIIQTNENRRRLYRRLAVFLVFAFTIIASISVTFYQQNSSIKAKEVKVEEMKKELGSLTKKEKKLQDDVQKLNDEEYVLKIARRDYFFSGKGEIIFPVSK